MGVSFLMSAATVSLGMRLLLWLREVFTLITEIAYLLFSLKRFGLSDTEEV